MGQYWQPGPTIKRFLCKCLNKFVPHFHTATGLNCEQKSFQKLHFINCLISDLTILLQKSCDWTWWKNFLTVCTLELILIAIQPCLARLMIWSHFAKLMTLYYLLQVSWSFAHWEIKSFIARSFKFKKNRKYFLIYFFYKKIWLVISEKSYKMFIGDTREHLIVDGKHQKIMNFPLMLVFKCWLKIFTKKQWHSISNACKYPSLKYWSFMGQ